MIMNKEIILYGKHPVLLSLKNRKFFKIYTSNIKELEKYIKDNKININKSIIEYRDNNSLSKMVNNSNHQGYVAITDIKKNLSIYDFVDIIKDKKELPRLLILDQLTDPHNIGAIIRTAVAFNIEYIILTKYNSLNDLSIISKTSAGMINMVNIIEVINLNNTIDILKKAGYFIIGMAGEAKQDIKTITDNKNICLIIGNEGNGIRQLVKKNCDILCKITTNNNVESLNASVATAISIYILWGNL